MATFKAAGGDAVKLLQDYTRVTLKRLKKRAIKQTGGRVLSVSHVIPRAYCVAKPVLHMAVFAVPGMDREQYVKGDVFVIVQNDTCKDVQHGDWCSLGYVSTERCGQMVVINGRID